MEDIELYKMIEGVFELPKHTKRGLILFFVSLFLFLIFLFFPFFSYQSYICMMEEETLLFFIPKTKLEEVQESSLFINGKKYKYKIIDIVEKQERSEEYLLSIKLSKKIKYDHRTFELTFKGAKKSFIQKGLKALRKEFVLSQN